MQELDNIFIAMVVSTSIIIFLSILFVLIIFNYHRSRLAHKKEIFQSIYIAQEEERRRIAMDIHDDVGAKLIELQIEIKNLLHCQNLEEIKSGIDKFLPELKYAHDITRLTSHALMPESLSEYGLNSGIRELVRRYETSLQIRYEFSCEFLLPKFMELNIYRIISELIANTFKHAHATTIVLLVKENTKHVVIEFSDNGVGFDFQAPAPQPSGIGIRNIKDRVEFLRGKITFKNNKGSNFIISIPKP